MSQTDTLIAERPATPAVAGGGETIAELIASWEAADAEYLSANEAYRQADNQLVALRRRIGGETPEIRAARKVAEEALETALGLAELSDAEIDAWDRRTEIACQLSATEPRNLAEAVAKFRILLAAFGEIRTKREQPTPFEVFLGNLEALSREGRQPG